jgi:hypothetical protein
MPSYMYLGHGHDIVDQYGKLNTSPVVGDDFMSNYVTVNNIDHSSYLYGVLNLLKINLRYKKYINNPYTYYDKLSILISGYDKEGTNQLWNHNLHLKTIEDYFINNYCDFVAVFDSDDKYIKYLYKSGLYKLENHSQMNKLRTRGRHSPEDEMLHHFNIDTRIGIDFNTIRAVYDGSVFPTSDEIIKQIKHITKKGTIKRAFSAPNERKTHFYFYTSKRASSAPNSSLNKTNLTIPYDIFIQAVKNVVGKTTCYELFTQFPGNHYNFMCRDLNGPLYNKIETYYNTHEYLSRPEYNDYVLNDTRQRFKIVLTNFFDDIKKNMGSDIDHFMDSANVALSPQHMLQVISTLFVDYIHKDIHTIHNMFIINTFIKLLNIAIDDKIISIKDVPPNIIEQITQINESEPPRVIFDKI